MDTQKVLSSYVNRHMYYYMQMFLLTSCNLFTVTSTNIYH